MKTLLVVGSLLAATAAPAAASAATRCINPQNNTTTGALVGAAGGAAVGSVLAGRHSRGEGAVLGALGGALLGGAIGHNQTRCPDGYYAYDDQTRQYYDNSGAVYNPGGPPPPGPGYGPPPPPGPAYGPGPGPGGDFWASSGPGIRDRITFLRSRVQANVDNGRISPRQAQRSFADLDDIQRQDRRMRYRDGGRLNDADRAYLQDRLDRARQILRDQRNGVYN